MPDLFGIQSPSVAPIYPHRPGFKSSRDGPSAQAAKVIAPTVTGRRREVLDYLRTRATEPMTADDIAAALNRSPFGVRPRVSELAALGLIERADARGKNQSGMTASRWRLASDAVMTS